MAQKLFFLPVFFLQSQTVRMFWSGLIAYADQADPAEALVPVFSDETLFILVLVAMIQT